MPLITCVPLIILSSVLSVLQETPAEDTMCSCFDGVRMRVVIHTYSSSYCIWVFIL